MINLSDIVLSYLDTPRPSNYLVTGVNKFSFLLKPHSVGFPSPLFLINATGERKGICGQPSPNSRCPDEAPVLSQGWWDSSGRDYHQVYRAGKAKRKSRVKPTSSIKRKSKTKNTDVLSLSFAAGVKVPIWI